MEPLSVGDMGLRLGAGLLLGGLVGLERERKRRPAGFRTMILISLGSAAFMLAGIEAIALANEEARRLAASSNTPAGLLGADISRILQGLIGGIGFLGAGAVIQNKKAVRGLTTAAAVWCTSAIGAACGLGLFRLAGVTAVAALFTLVVLEIVEERYFPEHIEGPDEDRNGRRASDDPDRHGLGPKS